MGLIVIAKPACNIKPKPGLTMYVRIIADLRRNGFNRFVRSAKRIVLSRLTERLEVAAELDECLVASKILSHLSCDFAGAFSILRSTLRRGGFLLRNARVLNMSSFTPSFTEEEAAHVCVGQRMCIPWSVRAEFVRRARGTTWINAVVECKIVVKLTYSIPAAYIDNLRQETDTLLELPSVELKRLKRFAGSAN